MNERQDHRNNKIESAAPEIATRANCIEGVIGLTSAADSTPQRDHRRSPVQVGEIDKMAEHLSSRWANPYEMLAHIDALTAERDALRAEVDYWQDMAVIRSESDTAWERYGLACHRKYLDIQRKLAKAEAEREDGRIVFDQNNAYYAKIQELEADRDTLRARPWVVYDPYDGIRECESEQHALDNAEAAVDGYLADGSWDEDVADILVAQVTHHVVKRVLGVKAEMTPDKWDELTGGSDSDEWWHYDVVPQPEKTSGSDG